MSDGSSWWWNWGVYEEEGPPPTPGDKILLENGDFILLESGDKILREV